MAAASSSMDTDEQGVPKTGEFDSEGGDSGSPPGCMPRRDPIKIKLKLPKPDEGSSTPRICDFCGRRFPNGKALGGHVRIHNPTMKNKASGAFKKLRSSLGVRSMDRGKGAVPAGPGRRGNREKEQVCKTCGKTFRSKKSLFGHMRAHAQRNDRWGRPPSDEDQSSNSEESSDQEIEVDERSHERGEDSGSKVTDLLKGLPNWSKTDKRGRVSPSEAARNLMWMSRMGNSSSYDRTNELPPRSNRFRYEPESPPKKLILEDRGDAQGRRGKGVRVQTHPAGSKGKEPAQNRTLRRKEVSLKNSTQEGVVEEASRSETGLSQDAKRVRYQCSTCGRNFPTFQALGGHRSSHNKEKGSTSASASASYNNQAQPNNPCPVVEASASTVNNAVVAASAETNKEEGMAGPSSTSATGGAYQCAICKMIFETLEALGDHNLRCERRKAPMLQPGEPSGQGDNRDQSSLDQNNKPSPGDEASQVGPRAVVIDLNELPPEYYDGPVSQNQLSSNTEPPPDPPENCTP